MTDAAESPVHTSPTVCDPAPMQRIDSGSFLMGGEDDDAWVADGEGPVRRVELDAFCIDAFIRALVRTAFMAGNAAVARMAMIDITTKSSTSVNPPRLWCGFLTFI